jgi:hypothetical protein
MKIVPYDPANWRKDHPTGAIAFQHMLKGEPGSPDNFMYILGRQDADFAMPPHRHNFDQIRLPLRGAMNHGRGVVVGEGEIGYFPEGLAYGPQDDPLRDAKPGERMQLVLQFGGASTYGFMSIEQRREAWAELGKVGSFEGPFYIRPDGKREWGLNSVWKQVFGAKIRYPRARYKHPIIADPKCFHWLHMHGAPGVEHKYMGAFSERAVWIELIRLRPHATWSSLDPRARRLFVVLSGTGRIGEQAVNYLTALQVDPGETLELHAAEELTLFLIGLPPIETPAVESDEFDFEEMPATDTAKREVAP